MYIFTRHQIRWPSIEDEGVSGGGNGSGAAAPAVVVELHDFDVKKGHFPPQETWGDYDGAVLEHTHTPRLPLQLCCCLSDVRVVGRHTRTTPLTPLSSIIPPGFLLPGSYSSAYDDEAWIHELKRTIRCVSGVRGRACVCCFFTCCPCHSPERLHIIRIHKPQRAARARDAHGGRLLRAPDHRASARRAGTRR